MTKPELSNAAGRARIAARKNVSAQRSSVAALVIGVGAFLVLAVLVASAKRPWSDEGWFASPAFNLAYHGFMGTTVLYSPHLPRIDQHTYWILPLYLVGLAEWFKVFGFGLLTMRFYSAVFGAIAIWSWYVVAQKLTRDYAIAAVTAVLLGTDYLFINVGTLGRPDMMCAGLGSLALALYLIFREKNFSLAFFVANVALACAFFTHPNVVLYAALFGLLVLVLDRHSLRLSILVKGAVPYIVGAAIWLVYISKDPAAFRAQLTGNTDPHSRFGNFLHPLLALKAELFNRYFTAYGLGSHSAGHTGLIVLKLFILICYALAVVTCLGVPSIRRRTGVGLVLIMTGLVFLIQCFFNQKLSWYLVHIVPLYILLLATAFVALWQKSRWGKFVLTTIFLALLGVQVGGSLYLFMINPYRYDYLPLLTFLNRLPLNQSINGSAAILFGLHRPDRLRDDATFGYYDHHQPAYIVMDPLYEEALEGLRYNDPPAYRFAEKQLKATRKLYDKNEFQVYATH